jgi:phenylacetic acid degradation operon negative regulatory protein
MKGAMRGVKDPNAELDAGPRAPEPIRQGGAKSLLTTMLGEFVLPNGGNVWTTTLVNGLVALDVSERNARQTIARSRDQGLIEVERHGRLARWHLTDDGSELLTAGAARIYGLGARVWKWDHRWLIVICAIPETSRSKRHRFRTQMSFEGFGFISPGIAVSPHLDRENAANRILRSLNLDTEAITFTATRGSLTLDADVLSSTWELHSLADEYRSFIEEFDSQRARTPLEAHSATVRMVDAWRRFPFVDPDLPSELLPSPWVGSAAHAIFGQRRTEWNEAATKWFETSESEVDALVS